MPELRLRDSHTSVRDYYKSLGQYSLLEATHEGAVQAAFGTLLHKCAVQFEWAVVGQYELPRDKKRALRVDGAVLDRWKLPRGYWEAKDEHDDLAAEAKKKIALGYPTDNILFQSPDRAILYQNGKRILDADVREPGALVDVLKAFFQYEPPAFAEWERAADDFGLHVPKLAAALLALIEKERRESKRFAQAFQQFFLVCQASINPSLSEVAVEKMLVQHLLTERIFRKVFDNPDFARRNIVAIEIERVIDALTGRAFNRQKFLGELDRFYLAIEKTAAVLDDHVEKQHFLNTIYERFFQSFDAKTADTHGIVYTPQSIVRFMVRNVDEILRKEFGRSLGHTDVHVIDPFVGTGNFLVNVMRHVPATQLEHKYANELHANEVMLLPYYVASMNIEHEYAEITGQYQSFDGMCFVDTFELAESQERLPFAEGNAARVARQRRSPIFVVLGNPPYNAWQQDENDQNKNRKYAGLDGRIADTYAKDSAATLKNSLSDPYVKAFRWATDRIGHEGIVAFVTNNGFIDGLACDGMRKRLSQEFDRIYLVNLGGNVRKNPKLSGTTHNVFGIQVGVAIALFVRKRQSVPAVRSAQIMYAATGEDWRKEEKYKYLDSLRSMDDVPWRTLEPDAKHTWLTDGLRSEFSDFIPLVADVKRGQSEPAAIFRMSSNGVQSNNDAYVYGFAHDTVTDRAHKMVRSYNAELRQRQADPRRATREPVVDERTLKWVRKTKRSLSRGEAARARNESIVRAVYRPFTRQWLFFDPMFNEDLYQLPRIFGARKPLRCICVTDAGSEKPFMAIAVAAVPDRHLVGAGSTTRVLPFTIADDDNVTDWARDLFRRHYGDDSITKEDIFHYTYALLHHSTYRERYALNLRRELPRIPLVPDFLLVAGAGARLMELHLNYDTQEPFSLRHLEVPSEKLSWRANKMRITKDRQGVVYNDFLTLAGIPPEAFEYRLGSRSALEWLVDQYQVETDKRSGITNDPNRVDEPQYIVRLIGQVVTVSLETMKIVKSLPALDVVDKGAAPTVAKAKPLRPKLPTKARKESEKVAERKVPAPDKGKKSRKSGNG